MKRTELSSREITNIVSQLLDDKKADNIVVIEMTEKTSMMDFMVIASGSSGRQVSALSNHLVQFFKQQGFKPHVEGLVQCDWVLVDIGDVIIHIFKPEARLFYDLEKMWGVSMSGSFSAET